MSEREVINGQQDDVKSGVDEWLSTSVLDHVRKLRKEAPETADKVLQMVEEHMRHLREVESKKAKHCGKLEWAWFAFRVFMSSLGFGALIIYAHIGWHLIDSGNPQQAIIVLGAGAASVIAIFVTGRTAGPLFGRGAPRK